MAIEDKEDVYRVLGMATPILSFSPPYLIQVKTLPDLILWTCFSDLSEKLIDFKKYELSGLLMPLRKQSFFEQVYLEGVFPTWPNGLDLDPDELWELGVPYQQTASIPDGNKT